MNSSQSEDFRRKAWAIHEYIENHLYLNRRELTVGKGKFNAALLLSMITALGQGKALIIGEPGLGKTTSAEWVSALFYRIPLGVLWRGTVSGHPEQTEEKIIGRPDLGRLNRGEEVVRWSYFTLIPTKIVDEINRLPETKQSMILDGVDRGKWEYLNDAVINEAYCFFATANYADHGTHTIVSPLLDRFDVMVESRHPGANLSFRIGADRNTSQLLRNPEMEAAFHDLMTKNSEPQKRAEQMEILCRSQGERLERELGIPTLSLQDLIRIRAYCRSIPFDTDANAFLRLILSELSFCHPYGQKRIHETCQEGCHFSEYLCHDIKSCLSNRFPMSVQLYCQVLAWLLGDESVNIVHLKAIAPYALSHRAIWHERAIARWDTDQRNDPLVIYMGKKAVSRMHHRYMEQSQLIKDALTAAYCIAEGQDTEPVKGDHPLYWDILRDLNLSQDSEHR